MGLRVEIRKRLAHFDLDVAFRAGGGEIVVLIGPSGAGKTTIMRVIAGLEKPDQGRISFGGLTWVDTGAGTFVRPQKRGLGYVFQEYTLFPHLNLYRNVAFAATDRAVARDLMAHFGIGHLAPKRPHRVSGGERQRAAICQALARRPKALLLDEPFSSLDQPTRKRLQKELRAFKGRAGMPIIHVTHDLNEALLLGDHILPIVEGRITPEWLEEQMGDLAEEHRAALEYLRDGRSPASIPAGRKTG